MFEVGAVVYGAFLGACCGSIAGAMSWRIPRGINLWQRSTCDTCGHVLGPLVLVPLLSWVIGRGRTRCCGRPIGKRYLALELCGAGFLAAAASHIGFSPHLWALAVLLTFLLTIGMTDLESKAIYLWPVLLLAAAGIAYQGLFYRGWWGAAMGMASLGGLLGVIAIGFWGATGRVGLGEGDVAMAAAVGAWLGWVPIGGPMGIPSAVLFPMVAGLAQVLMALGWKVVFRDDKAPMAPGLAASAFVLLTATL